SYLVHDFYRRFVTKDAEEKHYVFVGRMVTIGLFAAAAATTYLIDTAKDAFDVILQIGAGTGLLYLMRWFWWRINASFEVVAMISSFLVSLVFLVVNKNLKANGGEAIGTHVQLILTIAVTTVCWIATAFVTSPTDMRTLVDFYKKVRPFGP